MSTRAEPQLDAMPSDMTVEELLEELDHPDILRRLLAIREIQREQTLAHGRASTASNQSLCRECSRWREVRFEGKAPCADCPRLRVQSLPYKQ